MNQFGNEFVEIYKRYTMFNYLKKIKIGKYDVVEFLAPNEMYNNCYKIAREKAKHTMDYSQSLEVRTQDEKVIKQFKGILAETAIHIFLVKECDIPFDYVKRWDLEREDFEYSNKEYDLKIITQFGELLIESRASDSYKTTLEQFMDGYDIIGSYCNSIKESEKLDDLYLRPVYQYSVCIDNKEWKKSIFDTYKMISDSTLHLFLVSGATQEEMFGDKSYTKSMGQGDTKYRCIAIRDAGDITHIQNEIITMYNEIKGD